MKEYSSLQKKIIDYVVCNACDETSPGLLNGTLGICLALFSFASEYQIKSLTKYAEHLLKRCIDKISVDTPISFSNGLCGISWGIDYLIHGGYVTGDSTEALETIDSQIAKIAPSRLDDSLEYGLKGLLHYILAHSKMGGYKKENFNAEFIHEVHCVATKHSLKNTDCEMVELCIQFENWYKFNQIQYEIQVSKFVKLNRESITKENYMSYPIGLSDGLCGFLIK